jgi:hypothetical protein
MNKRPKLVYKRERLRMKHLLKRKEESFTISRLNVSQSRLQVKLRLKPKLSLNSSKSKARLRSSLQSLKPKPGRSLRLQSLTSKRKRLS